MDDLVGKKNTLPRCVLLVVHKNYLVNIVICFFLDEIEIVWNSWICRAAKDGICVDLLSVLACEKQNTPHQLFVIWTNGYNTVLSLLWVFLNTNKNSQSLSFTATRPGKSFKRIQKIRSWNGSRPDRLSIKMLLHWESKLQHFITNKSLQCTRSQIGNTLVGEPQRGIFFFKSSLVWCSLALLSVVQIRLCPPSHNNSNLAESPWSTLEDWSSECLKPSRIFPTLTVGSHIYFLNTKASHAWGTLPVLNLL